ncbi:MAG: prepilin-type N-terminal cleavage/methylation domain-containing protein [Patescibacteria group bacterium]|nr:prepilin-type N-terminal cleavage/methylation domain-containing protein [Patescibacteria group bacterium]MCL5224164.1 prepilin-type N-terminal cleavage/methylation domain-containing protein [Patescibacteria group bacterium]
MSINKSVPKSGWQSGFTLIELMVAMAIFLILISLSTAIFIQTLRTQQEITNITGNNESASEVLEQISRDVRTGTNFSIPDQHTLTFLSAQFLGKQGNYQIVGYKLVGDAIARCLGGKCQQGTYDPITPPGVNIADMSFWGMNLTSGIPRITITIAVTTPTGAQPQVDTYLETTISARNY